MDFAALIEQGGELKGLESLQGYNVEMGIGQAGGCRWPQDAHKPQEGHSHFTPIGFSPILTLTHFPPGKPWRSPGFDFVVVCRTGTHRLGSNVSRFNSAWTHHAGEAFKSAKGILSQNLGSNPLEYLWSNYLHPISPKTPRSPRLRARSFVP